MATDLLNTSDKSTKQGDSVSFGDNLCWHDAISNEKSMKMDEAVSI